MSVWRKHKRDKKIEKIVKDYNNNEFSVYHSDQMSSHSDILIRTYKYSRKVGLYLVLNNILTMKK